MRGGRRGVVIALAVFVVAFSGYLFGAQREATDTANASVTAVRIVHDHRLDLGDPGDDRPRVGEITRHGRVYDGFSLSTALLLTPFTATELAFGISPRAASDPARPAGYVPQALLGAVLAASAVAMFWRLAVRRAADPRSAAVVTLLFALGTSVWSSASRLPWTNGQVLVLLTAAVLALRRGSRSGDIAAGMALGVAPLVRPTAVAALLCLGAWLLFESRRRAVHLFLGAVLAAAVPAGYYLAMFGTVGPPYYGSQHLVLPTVASVFGPMVSPARGLLVFSPFLVLLVWRLKRTSAVDASERRLDLAMLAAAALVWAAVASCSCGWWGGWALGPRLFTESMTFLALPLLPVVDSALERRRGLLRNGLVSLGLVVSCWSIGINAVMVSSFGPWVWNSQPDRVDHHVSRLWDWSDPPWLRW